jgi:putative SOS response-associated peptidase YedK
MVASLCWKVSVYEHDICEHWVMCGRYVVSKNAEDLSALFEVDIDGDDLPAPSWNIAPTQRIPVIIDSIPKGEGDDAEPIRRLEGARWGLVPGWAKDPSVGVKMFNARSEDVADKPSFRAAVKKRRAVIPASGYYEWHTLDGVKTPHFIHLPGEEMFAFAGLFEWWKNPAAAEDSPDKWMLSASIMTRAATGELAAIHDRMPVFLAQELLDDWLDPHEEGSQELVDAVADAGAEVAERVEFFEVGREVGAVQNNSAALIEPVSR